MCDLNRVTFWVIAGEVAYILCLIALGIAVVLAGSIIGAADNVGLMLLAIAFAVAATGSFTAALLEVDKCGGGPCQAEWQDMRTALIQVLLTLALFTVELVALVAVATVPFAGAAAILAFLQIFMVFTVATSSFFEMTFARKIEGFNTCQADAALPTIATVAVFFARMAGYAAIIWVLFATFTYFQG